MSNLIPMGGLGYLGLAIMGVSIYLHKKIGMVGTIAGLGIGFYIYWQLDSEVTT